MNANKVVPKFFFFQFIFFTLIFNQSCRKNSNPIGSLTVYLPDTVLNCKAIVFNPNTINKNNFDLIFYNYAGEFPRETFSFDDLPRKIGRNTLTCSRGAEGQFNWFNTYSDGDVLGGHLVIDTSYRDTNWVEIIESDKKFKCIKGKFQAMVMVEYGDRWGDTGKHFLIHGDFSIKRRNND